MHLRQPWIHEQIGIQKTGEQPCGKRCVGSDSQQVEYESTVCPGSHNSQPYAGVYQAQPCRLTLDAASPEVLSAIWTS